MPIVVIAKSVHASPVQMNIKELPMLCQRAISANAPDAASDLSGPDVDKDRNGDLSIHWSSSSNDFFSHPSGEKAAAKAIASACPKVVMVIYSGPMGSTERWYIRRDEFIFEHSRDSGMPGDKDKYWGWNTVPFNYDQRKHYK